MKRLAWHTGYGTLIATFLLVPLLSACDASSVINQDLSQDCINESCLTFTTWAQNIDNLINKQAVGYAYIIMNHGLLMAKNAFGQAHTATDPPTTAMTEDLSSNVASVTKTITAVAVLKLLAAKGVSVTSPIYPYLPSSWTLGPNVKTITFAELLTHTSGIRENFSPNTDTTYANLQSLIQQGIQLSDKVYSYQNANFALFRIIIPYLNGFNDTRGHDLLDSIISSIVRGRIEA